MMQAHLSLSTTKNLGYHITDNRKIILKGRKTYQLGTLGLQVELPCCLGRAFNKVCSCPQSLQMSDNHQMKPVHHGQEEWNHPVSETPSNQETELCSQRPSVCSRPQQGDGRVQFLPVVFSQTTVCVIKLSMLQGLLPS